jgi:hypothetical protein
MVRAGGSVLSHEWTCRVCDGSGRVRKTDERLRAMREDAMWDARERGPDSYRNVRQDLQVDTDGANQSARLAWQVLETVRELVTTGQEDTTMKRPKRQPRHPEKWSVYYDDTQKRGVFVVLYYDGKAQGEMTISRKAWRDLEQVLFLACCVVSTDVTDCDDALAGLAGPAGKREPGE